MQMHLKLHVADASDTCSILLDHALGKYRWLTVSLVPRRYRCAICRMRVVSRTAAAHHARSHTRTLVAHMVSMRVHAT